jgi:hypothetical protein
LSQPGIHSESLSKIKQQQQQKTGMVAHARNPSYLEGGDQEDYSMSSAQVKKKKRS